MNNYLAILADIKTKLETVPDRGVIHDYSRFTVNWGEYIARFKDASTGRIKGWEISRHGVTEHKRGSYHRHHRFILRGFLGWKDADATDKTFQELVEEVCAVFREAGPGAAWLYMNGDESDESPAQAPVIDARVFGNVLCHYCEIHLSVTERINPS